MVRWFAFLIPTLDGRLPWSEVEPERCTIGLMAKDACQKSLSISHNLSAIGNEESRREALLCQSPTKPSKNLLEHMCPCVPSAVNFEGYARTHANDLVPYWVPSKFDAGISAANVA